MQSGYGWRKTPPSSRSSRYLPAEVKSPFWKLKVCVEHVLRIWGEKDESTAESEHEGSAAPDIPIVSMFLRPLCQSRTLEQLSASLQALPLSPHENLLRLHPPTPGSSLFLLFVSVFARPLPLLPSSAAPSALPPCFSYHSLRGLFCILLTFMKLV